MRDLVPTPFNETEYRRLLNSGYRLIKLLATGKEIETSPDEFKREIVLIAHRKMPAYIDTMPFYFVPIEDAEMQELAAGDHDYVLYIERGPC